MKKMIRRLPDAEQEVMQALWAGQVPAARTDIGGNTMIYCETLLHRKETNGW